MTNTNVCMLYQGDTPHPAHRTFGDAVDSKYCHFETGDSPGSESKTGDELSRICTGWSLSGEYDVVIAEGSAPLQTALMYGLFVNCDATVLYLAADETFYTLKTRPTRHVWRILRPIVNYVLNGCISVSNMAYDWCRPYLGDLRNKIVHPPIPASRYADLHSLSSETTDSTFAILSVGRAEAIKNHQTLVEAVAELRDRIKIDLSLTLVGQDHPTSEYATHEWVSTPGYVSNEQLVAFHDRANLYVHPSIADAYPVATLEAMLSATPTVVTDDVGTAHRLSSSGVCKPTVRDLYDTIRRYIDMTMATRAKIGQRLRSSVETLTETSQASAFRAAMTELE